MDSLPRFTQQLALTNSHADLRERKQGQSAKKLYFDRKTGELLMRESVETDRHNIVLDQIYEDGFFVLSS